MVDSMANSVEDYLIDGLSFKLQPGASYVSDRRSVNFFAAGSNVYTSSSGARVIRINLTGDGWLDPQTVRVSYTLVNNDATANHVLRPITGGWGFFRRARSLVGGAIIDDVDYYNRVHEMMHILTSKANRDNDDIEGFNTRWDADDWYNSDYTNYTGLAPNTKKRISFKPLLGICNQPKYIPLSFAPITMEFELVNQATDPIISNGTQGAHITANNNSVSWQIEDVRVICDVVTLDSALQNSYAEHVLSGKALPINYSTFITQYQTLTSSDSAVNVTRAVSRLKSVFINFDNRHTAGGNDGSIVHSNVNTFMGPMATVPDGNGVSSYFGGAYNYLKELQWQLQIGSKMYPEFPCGSLSETFYQLKKALGIVGSAFHSVAINAEQYRNDKFIIGIDTEKILEAGFTGLNTRAGDLMIVRIKPANGSVGDMPLWATSMFIMLHTDQILEIRDTGCQVFD
jgi:hypothetical protein